MKTIAAVVVFLLLSACQSMPQSTVSTAKEVRVPVPVPCIDRDDIPKKPVFPLDAVDLTDPNYPLTRLVNAAKEEVDIRAKWIESVYVIFNACAKESKK